MRRLLSVNDSQERVYDKKKRLGSVVSAISNRQ